MTAKKSMILILVWLFILASCGSPSEKKELPSTEVVKVQKPWVTCAAKAKEKYGKEYHNAVDLAVKTTPEEFCNLENRLGLTGIYLSALYEKAQVTAILEKRDQIEGLLKASKSPEPRLNALLLYQTTEFLQPEWLQEYSKLTEKNQSQTLYALFSNPEFQKVAVVCSQFDFEFGDELLNLTLEKFSMDEIHTFCSQSVGDRNVVVDLLQKYDYYLFDNITELNTYVEDLNRLKQEKQKLLGLKDQLSEKDKVDIHLAAAEVYQCLQLYNPNSEVPGQQDLQEKLDKLNSLNQSKIQYEGFIKWYEKADLLDLKILANGPPGACVFSNSATPHFKQIKDYSLHLVNQIIREKVKDEMIDFGDGYAAVRLIDYQAGVAGNLLAKTIWAFDNIEIYKNNQEIGLSILDVHPLIGGAILSNSIIVKNELNYEKEHYVNYLPRLKKLFNKDYDKHHILCELMPVVLTDIDKNELDQVKEFHNNFNNVLSSWEKDGSSRQRAGDVDLGSCEFSQVGWGWRIWYGIISAPQLIYSRFKYDEPFTLKDFGMITLDIAMWAGPFVALRAGRVLGKIGLGAAWARASATAASGLRFLAKPFVHFKHWWSWGKWLEVNTFRSRAGLIYGPDKIYKNRIYHIMAHTKNVTDKASHGIFKVKSQRAVLKLVDSGYLKAMKNPKQFCRLDGVRLLCKVPMDRVIGRTGGEEAILHGVKPIKNLQLVLEQTTKTGAWDNIITAFPKL